MKNLKEIIITIATIAAMVGITAGISYVGESSYNKGYQQGYEEGMADSHADDMQEEIANLEDEISGLESDNDGLKALVGSLRKDVTKYQKATERATSDTKPAEEVKPSTKNTKKIDTTKEFRLNKNNNKLHDVDCGSGKSAKNTVIVHLTYEQLMNWGNYCGNCDPDRTPAY